MAMYRLNPNGGVVQDNGRSIPEDVENRHWREYLEWVAEGNTPDPVPAAPAKTAQDLLDETDQQMIRGFDWFLQFVVTNGALPTLADIPQALKDLYVTRKALRDSLP